MLTIFLLKNAYLGLFMRKLDETLGSIDFLLALVEVLRIALIV
jgi:hypothetical protein